MVVDDEERPVPLRGPVRRVVSIVPSLTEAVAATDRNLLVGATDWCTHPADLDVVRVRGTKNPDVERIVALRPDLVLANAEENRPPDLDALRAAGVAVYVTDIRTLDGAFAALRRMLAACGFPRVGWLADAEAAWAAVPEPAVRRRAVVPIWRRPWMAVGRDTFTGAVLARLGVDNVLADDPRALPAHRPGRAPAARPGRAARRAVRVHRRRRAGGVRRAVRARLGAAADLVRAEPRGGRADPSRAPRAR